MAIEVLRRADAPDPVGTVWIAARQTDARPLPRAPMRVFGRYALVGLEAGSGRYGDALGRRARVRPGDLLLVTPETPHWYGPGPGERWDETFLTFDGPLFDLLRERGRMPPPGPLVGFDPARWRTDADAFDLAALLSAAAPAPIVTWADRARARLEEDLGRPLDLAAIAGEFGLGEAAFRKRFSRAVGLPPGRYREMRRLEAARELLSRPGVTVAAAAEALGFVDAHHLSHRYKKWRKKPPGQDRGGTRSAGPGSESWLSHG